MSKIRRKKITRQSDTKRDKMAIKLFRNKRKETGLFGPGVTKLSKID